MAIKIVSQKTVPAVDMEYVHFDRFSMTINRETNRIAMTADVILYGLDGEGNKVFYSKPERVEIPDLMAFIGTLAGQPQTEAIQGLGAVQQGLGILMDKYKGWNFIQVE